MSHVDVQVPKLKITGLELFQIVKDLPVYHADEQLSAEGRQACIREVHKAAELLAAVPSLVVGSKPCSSNARERSFGLGR